jgi:ligand-binding SRPBCC domain-containing protein
MRWESVIRDVVDNQRFVDEMVRGPNRSWHHLHRFEVVGRGTEIHDIVTYRLPFGPLGRLVHRAFVRRQLDAIFDYRANAVAERFGEPLTRSHL